jgi:hypothetical protein
MRWGRRFRVDSGLRRNDEKGRFVSTLSRLRAAGGGRFEWIPACAGMTKKGRLVSGLLQLRAAGAVRFEWIPARAGMTEKGGPGAGFGREDCVYLMWLCGKFS